VGFPSGTAIRRGLTSFKAGRKKSKSETSRTKRNQSDKEKETKKKQKAQTDDIGPPEDSGGASPERKMSL
jgi:Sec-independent protein translocase protein TatA